MKKNALTNPWFVGIFSSIIAGILLSLISAVYGYCSHTDWFSLLIIISTYRVYVWQIIIAFIILYILFRNHQKRNAIIISSGYGKKSFNRVLDKDMEIHMIGFCISIETDPGLTGSDQIIDLYRKLESKLPLPVKLKQYMIDNGIIDKSNNLLDEGVALTREIYSDNKHLWNVGSL